MRKHCYLIAILLLVGASAFAGRLSVGPNGRYFQDDGKTVLLFGSGVWTIIPDTGIDIEDHNTWYSECGGNANRAALFAFFNVVGDGEGRGPWQRTGPGTANDGKPKFDLTKPNEAFWERARSYFESCQLHGIYVWLQIFDEPYVEGGPQRWFMNPFNPDNNVNDLPGLPGGQRSGEGAFYDPDNKPLMAIQDALVQRLLDETAQRFGNIVYEIGNEINMDSATGKAQAWQQHWCDFFRAYEKKHDVNLLLSNDTRQSLFDTDKDAFDVVNHHGFVGVRIRGEEPLPLARALQAAILRDAKAYGRPIVNSRPCSDPDRSDYPDIVSERNGRILYWTYFVSGAHIIGFRTTEESWKGGRAVERILEHLRAFINELPDVATMAPRPELVEGPALCLADAGHAYVLYFPASGKAKLDLSAVETTPHAQWYNPRSGEWRETETAVQDGKATFSAPDENDWTLYVFTIPAESAKE